MSLHAPLLILLAACGQTPTPDADERLLRDNRLAADDAALVRFFRERTLSNEQVADLKAKLALLGSPTFQVRNQAASELVKAGHNAKAMLLELARSTKTDLEIVRRAELCLRQINAGNEAELAQACARLVARSKPADAASTLISYVPFAGEEGVVEAVQHALNATAVRQGRADPIVLRALSDAHPARRAAAGEALVRAGGLEFKPVVAPLLDDPEPAVRLPVARALVEAKDKDAVPALIDRLVDAPIDDRWHIEEMLLRLAGEKPPVYLDGKTPLAKARDLWQKWWKDHADKVDLAKLSETPPYLGYVLVTQMQGNAQGGGKITELRPDGAVNFEIDNLSYPVDARVVGPNRVLIAEYMGRRVTERDFEGKVVWELPLAMPLGCQRLPGGDTFIVTRKQLLVVDGDKKVNASYTHPVGAGSITAAQRLRDGSTVLLASTGRCHWLDAQGRETKSFQAGYVYSLGGNIDVLPNRHILVPLYRDNQVVEFDLDGKTVWSAKVQTPVSATRLPNGHTLVLTLAPQRVVQLNAQGEEVWTHNLTGRGWRARGR